MREIWSFSCFLLIFLYKPLLQKGGSRSRGRGQLSEFFLIPVCFYGPLEQENMLIILNFQKKFFLGWSSAHQCTSSMCLSKDSRLFFVLSNAPRLF